MNSKLVTIVVAIYNVEKYLDKCIKSVIHQTYDDIQIILVNDGSTDNSLEICEKYTYDDRVQIINKTNGGLSSARQAGIDASRGKYICMIDADDYLEHDYVEKLKNRIEEYDSDICVCSTKFYSENMEKVYGFNNIKSNVKITKSDIESRYYQLLGEYYMSDSWNKMYKTSFIKKTKIKFNLEKKYNGTDLLFNHCLMLHLPKICIINEPLYNHQILQGSRVRRKDKDLQNGFMYIMDKIIIETENLNYSVNINKQLSLIYAKFLRESSQDLVNTIKDKKELNHEINKFYYNNEQYLLKNEKIKLNIKDMNTKSLKLFCFFLNNFNKNILLIYLKSRKWALKI